MLLIILMALRWYPALLARSVKSHGRCRRIYYRLLAEDCDLTIRILRQGYIIRNCTKAIAVTEAPETIPQFLKQRFRWSYGIMQSFWKNKDACFNPKYKGLGIVSLPNILLFQIILP
ncbi:glycosyltransferase family 2 protein [Niabella defluvii]|nr:glycosyltransferase family 2 protein [Niabella sp. I65]